MPIEMPEFEKKAIPNSEVLWNQKCVNKAKIILNLLGLSFNEIKDQKDIETFFTECEQKIKSMEKSCRITPNNEVYVFDGAEFDYIWYLYSETIKNPVKLALKIDGFEQKIYIGNIQLPSPKEERKLEKHIEKNINSQNSTIHDEKGGGV